MSIECDVSMMSLSRLTYTQEHVKMKRLSLQFLKNKQYLHGIHFAEILKIMIQHHFFHLQALYIFRPISLI